MDSRDDHPVEIGVCGELCEKVLDGGEDAVAGTPCRKGVAQRCVESAVRIEVVA
jgi:hypothetical protein